MLVWYDPLFSTSYSQLFQMLQMYRSTMLVNDITQVVEYNLM